MIKVVCIGAGKLANQLMPALETADCEVVQVYNRSATPAVTLAAKLKAATSTASISEIRTDADLYFLAVSDDAISIVADQLLTILPSSAIGVHCSGSLGLEVLPFQRKAAFYPLQSFSVDHETSWRWIPLIITTTDETIWTILDEIAGMISTSVYRMTDEQKSVLHVAAVFTNNFSNHMLTLAENICLKHHLPFEMLKPLILETFSKAILTGPRDNQTGPAVRGDQKTIEKHLALIKDEPHLTAIYEAITASIAHTVKAGEK
jgi:predicted short-subunit dehydrogenase-like oxidoreductase (DUF2520 family)